MAVMDVFFPAVFGKSDDVEIVRVNAEVILRDPSVRFPHELRGEPLRLNRLEQAIKQASFDGPTGDAYRKFWDEKGLRITLEAAFSERDVPHIQESSFEAAVYLRAIYEALREVEYTLALSERDHAGPLDVYVSAAVGEMENFEDVDDLGTKYAKIAKEADPERRGAFLFCGKGWQLRSEGPDPYGIRDTRVLRWLALTRLRKDNAPPMMRGVL